jgi:hypothetical protein
VEKKSFQGNTKTSTLEFDISFSVPNAADASTQNPSIP